MFIINRVLYQGKIDSCKATLKDVEDYCKRHGCYPKWYSFWEHSYETHVGDMFFAPDLSFSVICLEEIS